MIKPGRFIIAALLMVTVIFIAGCGGPGSAPKTLDISAAASLKDTLTDIKKKFEKENPNLKLSFNFASSGALQQQIIQGAPCDVFISAGKKQTDELVQKGLLLKDTEFNVAGNELVLIVPKEKEALVKSFSDLVALKDKIAIGTPETVPAGKYAQETLQKLGLWDKVKDRVVYTKDVRQVLAYVESGNVGAGLVYKTDAMLSEKVTVVASAPAGSHSKIVYPAAVTKNAVLPDDARKFLQYLKGPEANEIFKQYGFTNP